MPRAGWRGRWPCPAPTCTCMASIPPCRAVRWGTSRPSARRRRPRWREHGWRRARWRCEVMQGGPLVGIAMGSESDLATLRPAGEMLERFGVPYEMRVLSAHRTPRPMAAYAELAQARGLLVLIAGAGGAAHLPGMLAAHTSLPVIGVPVATASG